MSDSAIAYTSSTLLAALSGFEDIKRYWDRKEAVVTAKILPGEYYVTVNGEMITTVLGSCVSACIRDPAFGIGGMNHFMLPMSKNDCAECWSGTMVNAATRYGNFAMEHLINEILKQGARRDHLEIKVFGGGKVLATATDVGSRNIEFVMDYLHTEGFSVMAKDVGDIYPRKVNYYPQTGRVRMKKLKSTHNDTIVTREKKYMENIEHQPVGGDVDLF
ncbi:MAG: chemoreceptor glutamine deamidase CheD [Gammaproteobacteria bacterium]|nr:chemoreceptor glutamine deamidase CheD [Gammaproteobacteria bacterium]